MSEERFDRIDERLDRVETGQTGLRADVARLEACQNDLRADLTGHVGRLEGRIDDLDRHMHVLHEEAMDRIAAMPESVDALRVEMVRGFAVITEAIDRRLDPLEITVRQHSMDIERLKQTRG
jgi:hypothetical protein